MQRPTDLAELTGALAAIVDEARRHVAAGRGPDMAALSASVRAAAERGRRDADPEHAAAIDRAERQALDQLDRVLAVDRARRLLARRQQPPPARPGARRRALLRTRPTISGDLEVGRRGDGEAARLTWKADAAVASWEVRFSERPEARGDYVVRETLTLPSADTSVAVPLGDRPLRVHLLGRGRDGRIVRRALVSGLAAGSWNERWQRRPSGG